MVVPDVLFLILPFLFIALASMSDQRFAIMLYFLGGVSALLGVAFPYLTTATSDTYWFGILYFGMGIASVVMAVLTIADYQVPGVKK